MDSELVPCHLLDGGQREIQEGGGVKQKEKGRGKKAWGVFFKVNIAVSR